MIRKAEKEKVKLLEVENLKDVPGWGIEGKVNNVHYQIGKADCVGKERAKEFLDTVILQATGKTLVFVKNEHEIIGALALKDVVRTDAKKAIEEINAAGVETYMLTGDSGETAHE